MAEESKPKKRGCLPRLISTFLFLMALGLGVALYFASQPQDLSDIKGYGSPADPRSRDLGAVVALAIERGGYDLTITEAEMNSWLAQTLDVKQGGLLADKVKIKGVAVRFEMDRAEVIIERSVFGHPFTTSMFLRIEKTEENAGVLTQIHLDGGAFHPDLPNLKKGGRIGKLVVPQGFLILVRPAFQKIGLALPKETENGIERMTKVSFEDGVLKLDPRDKMERDLLPQGTF